jgi:hypothetical protein
MSSFIEEMCLVQAKPWVWMPRDTRGRSLWYGNVRARARVDSIKFIEAQTTINLAKVDNARVAGSQRVDGKSIALQRS